MQLFESIRLEIIVKRKYSEEITVVLGHRKTLIATGVISFIQTKFLLRYYWYTTYLVFLNEPISPAHLNAFKTSKKGKVFKKGLNLIGGQRIQTS